MEGLIEFIFANLFLVIIIVTGLLSFFKNMLANQNKQGSPQKDKEEGSPLKDVMKRLEDMVETFENPEQTTTRRTVSKTETNNNFDSPIEETSATFQDQYEEQYERLQQQYQSIRNSNVLERLEQNELRNPITDSFMQTEVNRNENAELNVNLTAKLNKTGLIESIVMAEVLGPPRARRQHHRMINR